MPTRFTSMASRLRIAIGIAAVLAAASAGSSPTTTDTGIDTAVNIRGLGTTFGLTNDGIE